MFISSSIHIRSRRGIDDGKKLAHSETSDSRFSRLGGEERRGVRKGKGRRERVETGADFERRGGRTRSKRGPRSL